MSRRAIYSANEVLRMVFDSDSDDAEMDDGSDMEIDVSCYFTILSKNKLARLRIINRSRWNATASQST